MRLLLGVTAAAFIAASMTSAQADEWCGFKDKTGSRVRCGYSSLAECKQAFTGSKDTQDVFCLPDPSFAERRHAPHWALAAASEHN